MPSDRPVLPSLSSGKADSGAKTDKSGQGGMFSPKPDASGAPAPVGGQSGQSGRAAPAPASPRPATAAAGAAVRTRSAHLRLTRIDPLSVMKMAFLLSIAIGIILVVAVTIIWSVLSAVGVWDNINSAVQQVIGTESGENFDVSKYIGTPRVIGFSLIASVMNVVFLTALSTLAAFVYNLAAALLGGVEMTWAEDR